MWSFFRRGEHCSSKNLTGMSGNDLWNRVTKPMSLRLSSAHWCGDGRDCHGPLALAMTEVVESQSEKPTLWLSLHFWTSDARPYIQVLGDRKGRPYEDFFTIHYSLFTPGGYYPPLRGRVQSFGTGNPSPTAQTPLCPDWDIVHGKNHGRFLCNLWNRVVWGIIHH